VPPPPSGPLRSAYQRPALARCGPSIENPAHVSSTKMESQINKRGSHFGRGPARAQSHENQGIRMFTYYDMTPLIDDLARRIPEEVHPSGKAIIGEWLHEARIRPDEPTAIVNLMRKVAEKVALEMDWHAEKLQRIGPRRRITAETIELRRQADAWEAEASRYSCSRSAA
jgi:hypothetical protein